MPVRDAAGLPVLLVHAEALAPRADSQRDTPCSPRQRIAAAALPGTRPAPEYAAQAPSLANQPGDVLRHIAGMLSSPDCARLALTSKPMLAAAAGPLLDRLHDFEIRQHEPQGIRDRVAGLFALLRHASAPGHSAQEQGEFRALWDAAVLRLHALQPDERPAAFALLRGYLGHMPPTDRVMRLATLLGRMGDLPSDARAPLFTESLRAMRQELPAEHRAAPLAALLGCVDTLYPWNDSACARKLHLAIGRGHAAIMELPPGHRARPLAALLGRIREFPEDLARAYCQAGHRWVGRLPPEYRAEPLAVLLEHSLGAAWALDMSPQKEEGPQRAALGDMHRTEWERCLGLVQELPLPHRAAPLAELLARLDLSRPDRTGKDEWGCERGLALMQELPLEHRGKPLAALVDGLLKSNAFVAGGEKSIEVRERIHRLVDALPPDQRATPLVLLLEMSLKSGLVRGDHVAADYERGHALVAGLPSRHRSGPLAQLLTMIDRLPEDAQAAEYERGHRLVAELPPRDRDRPLAQLLAVQIDATPHDDRTAWYELGGYGRGLSLLAELPLQHRTETLCVLLGSIRRHVPKERRANEYQRGLRRVAELPLEQRSGPLHTLVADHDMLPPPERAIEYERALHLVGLLPPDQRGSLAMTLVSQLRHAVLHRFPEEKRADICVRSLHLVGESAVHRMNEMTRQDRETLQWLLARQPAAGQGHP